MAEFTTGSNVRVSVVVASHNGRVRLRTLLDSLAAQTFTDFEVVVVDDGSTDDTTALASRYDRVRVLRAPFGPVGPGKARNSGVEAACGDWIAIADDDDAFEPERLEVLVGVGERLGVDVVLDEVVEVPWPPAPHAEPSDSVTTSVAQGRIIEPPELFSRGLPRAQPMFRRSALRHARYSGDLWFGEDLVFLVELIHQQGVRVGYIDQGLYLWARRTGALSTAMRGSTDLDKALERCLRVNGIHSSTARTLRRARRTLRFYRVLDAAGWDRGDGRRSLVRMLSVAGHLLVRPGVWPAALSHLAAVRREQQIGTEPELGDIDLRALRRGGAAGT